ncbi:MAG: hypothetical protein P8Z38_13235, partial [Robiginitalea sp.]
MLRTVVFCLLLTGSLNLNAQDYFLEQYEPYKEGIPSPEEFLGYGIGEYHTRHDRIVHYLQTLASVSENAEIETYGFTHEKRRLVILRVSQPSHLENLPELQQQHLAFTDPGSSVDPNADLPIFVQQGCLTAGRFIAMHIIPQLY